jgi:hypothetical protein
VPSKEKLFHFAGVSGNSAIVMECEHSDKVIGDQCSMSGIKNRVFHFAEDDDNEEEEEEGDAGTTDGYNDEGESRGLGNLPAGCIALILAYTSPWDVARLALVNRTFGEASGCDLVWENMLPFNYSEVVSLAMNYRPLAPYNSKRDLYHLLCKQIFLQDGTEVIIIISIFVLSYRADWGTYNVLSVLKRDGSVAFNYLWSLSSALVLDFSRLLPLQRRT